MKAWLRKDVFAARCDGALIILDVLADVYAMITFASQDAVPPQTGPGFVEAGAGDVIDALEDAGLTSATPSARVCSTGRPDIGVHGDLSGLPVPHPRVADLFDAAWVFLLVPKRLARWPLARLVEFGTRSDPRAGETAAPNAEVLRRAAVFARLMIWSPWQGDCLFRSFLLVTFLRMGGQRARWVFGVRTRPFLAHCWVQSGETALNDEVERLKAFRPILWV